MRMLDQMKGWFRALFRSRRIDADLREEMEFHIAREAAANEERGMSSVEAYKAARMSFGSVDVAHELARDNRPGVSFRQITNDIRFGIRLLGKSRVFFATGIAIVAFGIGSATAIFSVVHGVMLRPLPFEHPERLVSIWLQRQLGRNLPAAADANELRQLQNVFADVALVRNANLNLTGDGEPQRLQAARVSPNIFSLLGVSPAIGRTFARDEDQAGRAQVVLISDALWRSRFGSNRDIVGQQIQLNGASYTVAGVMPRSFQYPTAAYQAWIPLVLEPGELTRAVTNNYRLVARLSEQATIEQARIASGVLAKRIAGENGPNPAAGFTIDSMLDDAVRDVRPALILLLGAVSFLLLIACVNLSNLFGARATARSGEFAVRLALGASRARLVAQCVAEAMPVLVLGGVIGVALAQFAVQAFVGTAGDGLPRAENVSLSIPVVAFSLVLLALTGFAVSIAPAVQAWKSDFTTVTKDGGRSSTMGRKRSLIRQVGVAAQIAFALPLLVGGALLLRSAMKVSRVDLGFTPAGISTLSFEVSRVKHPSDREVGDYYGRLIEAVRAIPGVVNASLVNRIPLGGGQTNSVKFDNGRSASTEMTNVDTRTVTPGYFATMGIKVQAGRIFTERDDQSTATVAIIDERIATAMWPGESPLGKRFRGPLWRDTSWVTVVGVVAHIRTIGRETDPLPQIYWNYRQWPQDRMVMAIKGKSDVMPATASVVAAIRSVDPDQSVYDIRTLDQIVERSMSQRRLTTILMASFSGLALLLTSVGIYGVVAYGVTQRLREFGIRVALGATTRELKRLVVWQGALMAIAGSAVGLLLAVAGTSAMSKLVFGINATDVQSILGATVVLIVVALVASYIPARRAAAVDPGITLRAD